MFGCILSEMNQCQSNKQLKRFHCLSKLFLFVWCALLEKNHFTFHEIMEIKVILQIKNVTWNILSRHGWKACRIKEFTL